MIGYIELVTSSKSLKKSKILDIQKCLDKAI